MTLKNIKLLAWVIFGLVSPFHFIRIKQEISKLMNAIENLNTAVTDQATTFGDFQTLLGDAFDELVSDIQGIPAASDVQFQADRVAANTRDLKDFIQGFAERIRGALPTADTTEPLPVGDDIPAPTPAPVETGEDTGDTAEAPKGTEADTGTTDTPATGEATTEGDTREEDE